MWIFTVNTIIVNKRNNCVCVCMCNPIYRAPHLEPTCHHIPDMLALPICSYYPPLIHCYLLNMRTCIGMFQAYLTRHFPLYIYKLIFLFTRDSMSTLLHYILIMLKNVQAPQRGRPYEQDINFNVFSFRFCYFHYDIVQGKLSYPTNQKDEGQIHPKKDTHLKSDTFQLRIHKVMCDIRQEPHHRLKFHVFS